MEVDIMVKNLKMKRGDSMRYTCKDEHNRWEMSVLKKWEKSYNSILNGTWKGEPADKVFKEIYEEIFVKGEY